MEDLESNRSLLVQPDIIQLVLWQILAKYNVQTLLNLDRLKNSEKTIEEMKEEPEPFPQSFMSSVVQSFQEELEVLRKSDEFNSTSVHLLQDILHSGCQFYPLDGIKELHAEWFKK
eukprot:TRINITY_DN838_c0_g1_i7.p1 TRINITY_DN838_c0_g1~~TRINITY_DN838_c0_g1_i7.p1  ORF type:complete len:116 (-),score=29.94 TRINITY_DN838_c0_g1_i7:91-438(-)